MEAVETLSLNAFSQTNVLQIDHLSAQDFLAIYAQPHVYYVLFHHKRVVEALYLSVLMENVAQLVNQAQNIKQVWLEEIVLLWLN